MFQNTTGLWKNIDFEDVQEQKESIFRMAACFEKFVLDYSHHHASESTTQIDIVPNSLSEWTCHSFLVRLRGIINEHRLT